MITKIFVLCAYFLIVLVIGFIARTRWKSTPDTYFLADRKFGTLILLGTMDRPFSGSDHVYPAAGFTDYGGLASWRIY